MSKKTRKGNTGPLSYTQQLKRDKWEKAFWDLYFHGFDEIPAHFDHVKLRLGTTTDEELELMTTKIKSIVMLDIYEAEITVDGIRHLTTMDSIKELRLKECPNIDNDCMEYLTQIKGLEFLQLKGTAVDLDGLKNIARLKDLKTLLVKSDLPDTQIRQRLVWLQTQLPACEFIINGKPPEFYLESQ